ncbi:MULTISPECIES: hypothetical protein [Pseudomonas]|jgi:hypothetical protein|uniref:hypothetical protein n=1 Tax=Pseudomonas TaxID=286 RepID=UPI00062B1813|nr:MULTISPECIES: hypothetical protein [Pseudomonas]KKX61251.1 hypothetical protein PU99_15460 [Pseudomonas putida]MCK8655130.1 hypothetical protein [Pseudomonas umsongensis]NBB64332.1 hypothetical protein [Pseudomonas sp. ODNR1LW]OMQ32842.1 hypothetical protein BKX96_22175 [Pseudomonas putida]
MSIDMQLQATANLLRRGDSLDRLSTGLTLLGALLGLSQYLVPGTGLWSLVCSGGLLVLGLWQKYWALRVGFDADLFRHLADRAEDLPQRTQDLDQALTALGMQPAERGGRPWSERITGALKLLRRQALLVVAQVLLTLFFILASPWLNVAG